MKKLKTIPVILGAVMLISGCGNGEKAPVQEIPENNEVGNTDVTITQNVIKSSVLPDEVSEWHAVGYYEGDVDGDNNDEVIKLVTSAECDEDGNVFWSDGQNWALYVEDGDVEYLLYKDYINTGCPYFEVSDYYAEKDTNTQIDLIISNGSHLALKGYTYSQEEQGFVETVIYDSNSVADGGLNKKYSSLPMYGE